MEKKNDELVRLRRRFVLILLSALLVLSVAGYATYAWFFIGDETGSMEFRVLQIDSEITMYEAIDANRNGVPDRLVTNGRSNGTYRYTAPDAVQAGYVAYDLPYYTEVYDFAYHDTTLVLSEDSTANMFAPLTLQDLYPSRVYTVKYALANYSFADNEVTFSFDTSSSSGYALSSMGALSAFRVRMGIVNAGGAVTFGNWEVFPYTESGVLQRLPMQVSDAPVVIDRYEGEAATGRLDIWLQFQFLPEAGNALQNTQIVFPDFRITFDATYDG